MRKYVYILCVCAIAVSCADKHKEYSAITADELMQDTRKAKQYLQWVESDESGMCVLKKAGEYELKLQYEPANYRLLKERKEQEQNGIEYYMLTVKNENYPDLAALKNNQDYSKNVEYLSFYMQHSIHLLCGSDTMKCVLYHYERNYGVSPDNTFLLAFERPDAAVKGEDRVLVLDDQQLGIGRLKFRINADAIIN